jgi:GrpB-like predicted nucleotidyltransferase (UPF0157 family)
VTVRVGKVEGARIVVCPYDELWPAEFVRVREELRSVLPDGPLAIEHVGSTSVPGLAAKPIIDVMVTVPDLDGAIGLVPAIESLGFEYRAPEELPDRHYFRRIVNGVRLHHLSLAEPDSRHARNTLLFRDALREDARLAAEYAALKRRLAEEVGHDRLAYLNGKTEFILAVLSARGGVLGDGYPTVFVGSGPR